MKSVLHNQKSEYHKRKTLTAIAKTGIRGFCSIKIITVTTILISLPQPLNFHRTWFPFMRDVSGKIPYETLIL